MEIEIHGGDQMMPESHGCEPMLPPEIAERIAQFVADLGVIGVDDHVRDAIRYQMFGLPPLAAPRGTLYIPGDHEPLTWLMPTIAEQEWVVHDIVRRQGGKPKGLTIDVVPDTQDDDYVDIVATLSKVGVAQSELVGVSAFAQSDGLVRWIPAMQIARVWELHEGLGRRRGVFVLRARVEPPQSAYEAQLEQGRAQEYWDVLIDLARAGDEQGFRDLARSLGVKEEDLDAMWTGTLARVGKKS